MRHQEACDVGEAVDDVIVKRLQARMPLTSVCLHKRPRDAHHNSPVHALSQVNVALTVQNRTVDILGGLKFKFGHVTRPRPFQGRFVVHRSRLNMISLYIKFEIFTFTYYEDTKSNIKCRNWDNFGWVGVTKVIGNMAIR